MSIPKGLILYKAARHQENFPVDRKYGHYSRKLFSLSSSANPDFSNFQHRYQKKFVQEIWVKLHDKNPRPHKALKMLSKFQHIKRFSIDPRLYSLETKAKKKLVMRIFQRIFKTLKRIKNLTLHLIEELKKTRLLSRLESLALPSVSYSEDYQDLNILTYSLQQASKRRSWPCLKSLEIKLLPPFITCLNPEDSESVEDLLRLLGFMSILKDSCPEFHKCASFQLELPSWIDMSPEQACLLVKIAKITQSITHINHFEMRDFLRLPEMVQHAKGLKKISLDVYDELEERIDLSVLNRMPDFQELTVSIWERQGMDKFLYKDVLAQLQALENLTTLSLKFEGIPFTTIELSRVIGDLVNLKNLELVFGNRRHYESDLKRYKLANGRWLQETFKAIGEKSKLERLYVSFITFDFENSGSLFKELCQSLKKLTQLSDFKLKISNAETIKDEGVLKLCQSLNKLSKMQDFSLQLSKGVYFETKTLVILIDCLVKSFPCLSRLSLRIYKVKIAWKSYKLLSEAINQMKCLNSVVLDFEGEIESKMIAFHALEAEIRAKKQGKIHHRVKSFY